MFTTLNQTSTDDLSIHQRPIPDLSRVNRVRRNARSVNIKSTENEICITKTAKTNKFNQNYLLCNLSFATVSPPRSKQKKAQPQTMGPAVIRRKTLSIRRPFRQKRCKACLTCCVICAELSKSSKYSLQQSFHNFPNFQTLPIFQRFLPYGQLRPHVLKNVFLFALPKPTYPLGDPKKSRLFG